MLRLFDDLKEMAEEYREKMLEAVAETDDELMEKYLGGEELTEAEIKAAIRKATIACKLCPVTCGTSYRNKGVQPMLDAVIDYMPAPTDSIWSTGMPAEAAVSVTQETIC